MVTGRWSLPQPRTPRQARTVARRTPVLAVLAALLVLAGAGAAFVLWQRAEPGGPGPAARALAPLPPG